MGFGVQQVPGIRNQELVDSRGGGEREIPGAVAVAPHAGAELGPRGGAPGSRPPRRPGSLHPQPSTRNPEILNLNQKTDNRKQRTEIQNQKPETLEPNPPSPYPRTET